jgi:hypothetical protein
MRGVLRVDSRWWGSVRAGARPDHQRVRAGRPWRRAAAGGLAASREVPSAARLVLVELPSARARGGRERGLRRSPGSGARPPPADEALDEGVLLWLAQRHVPVEPGPVGPRQHRARGQFRAHVADDGIRATRPATIPSNSRAPEIEVSAAAARDSRVKASITTTM